MLRSVFLKRMAFAALASGLLGRELVARAWRGPDVWDAQDVEMLRPSRVTPKMLAENAIALMEAYMIDTGALPQWGVESEPTP
jgi:hypothetical protein